MRYVILAIAMFLLPAFSIPAQAQTQFSISIGDRGVSLGFVMSTYPTLQRIPGYPVYYDPRADANYFFYDGLYWVYQDDNWYSSPWYNGPWDMIQPAYVPAFILRVPVRYYRRPPPYFRGWRSDAPPRWGQHWGPNWQRQRSGWDRWNRRSVPRPAPLPTYQRNYTGNRYPSRIEQQRSIETRNYRYRPRDTVSREILNQRRRDARLRDQQRQQQQRQREIRQRQNEQQQQQREIRQRQNVQQQQQREARQRQNERQQQQREVRQRQNVQQQQQREARQRQNVQQQQQREARQRQNVQQQQQRNAQQRQRNVQQQQQQDAASRQDQRSRPASKSRAKDKKDKRVRSSDKNGDKKDGDKTDGGGRSGQ